MDQRAVKTAQEMPEIQQLTTSELVAALIQLCGPCTTEASHTQGLLVGQDGFEAGLTCTIAGLVPGWDHRVGQQLERLITELVGRVVSERVDVRDREASP